MSDLLSQQAIRNRRTSKLVVLLTACLTLVAVLALGEVNPARAERAVIGVGHQARFTLDNGATAVGTLFRLDDAYGLSCLVGGRQYNYPARRVVSVEVVGGVYRNLRGVIRFIPGGR